MRGIFHGEIERVTGLAFVTDVDRDHTKLFGDFSRDQVQQLSREIDVAQGNPGHAQLLRQHAGHLHFADEPEFDQKLTEATAGRSLAALSLEGQFELLPSQKPCTDQ